MSDWDLPKSFPHQVCMQSCLVHFIHTVHILCILLIIVIMIIINTYNVSLMVHV